MIRSFELFLFLSPSPTDQPIISASGALAPAPPTCCLPPLITALRRLSHRLLASMSACVFRFFFPRHFFLVAPLPLRDRFLCPKPSSALHPLERFLVRTFPAALSEPLFAPHPAPFFRSDFFRSSALARFCPFPKSHVPPSSLMRLSTSLHLFNSERSGVPQSKQKRLGRRGRKGEDGRACISSNAFGEAGRWAKRAFPPGDGMPQRLVLAFAR